eukprot:CAMPEP_0168439000 /NCGR_PEP_ID=MMETSP0228-20121227/42246_1 /TAXON_ID=133427 /ORGANISM="Protoceratium reticulatum, Strain CCCM 535 (=CCMP 1889)" /LENGTH=112 /DNA_ID=CAMNT_0008453275 /DNA_START=46 /DNA_END=380 /DNA_ORIENTATION=+
MNPGLQPPNGLYMGGVGGMGGLAPMGGMPMGSMGNMGVGLGCAGGSGAYPQPQPGGIGAAYYPQMQAQPAYQQQAGYYGQPPGMSAFATPRDPYGLGAGAPAAPMSLPPPVP